jgi:hypothetical protein
MQKFKQLFFQVDIVFLVISTPHEGYYLLHFQVLRILIEGYQ